MLDIKFIQENSELVKLGITKKHSSLDLDVLLNTDKNRLSLLKEVEELRARQNTVGVQVTKAQNEERNTLIEEMRTLKETLKEKEIVLEEVMKSWRALMLQVPNIPDMSVPDGRDDTENIELRTWGDIHDFSFIPRDHITLLEAQDMADFERGTKTSGFRGYFLKGDAALLEMAIWHYVMDMWNKKGFTPMIVPSLVRGEALLGSGYLPQGRDDLYADGNDFLSGTGEVATMFYHSDEVLSCDTLPKKFIAFSPCFRKEAGSHGKDVKGLIRVHEFFKCEQVILCEASHTTSVALHEEITRHSEELMEALVLPYHTIVVCGGDLGLGQVKKYDIEGWMPSQKKYRETHSASYFHDFQTRRLNIRYKDEQGKMRFLHSLNNTAAATPRLVAVIIENYQEEDGRIRVPDVLKPYLGKDYLGKVVFPVA